MIATLLLLAALALEAGTRSNYTSTGYLVGVPVPGVWFTNALGEVSVKGNVQALRVQSSDPRLTGSRIVFTDAAWLADGSAILQCTAYQQVGTWNLADPKNPKFTPTGGVWEMQGRTAMQADNSLQLSETAFGTGGAIDGLRLEENSTRSAGEFLDPAVPYEYTGSIQKAPVKLVETLDNFDDNYLKDWVYVGSYQGSIIETHRQFVVRGYWRGTSGFGDSFSKGYITNNWKIADGQTLEWRVDLVGMNENTTAAVLEPGYWYDVDSYVLMKGKNYIAFGKMVSYRGLTLFSCDNITIKNTNVVLSLAMARVATNLVLTARVLDKDMADKVLFERSVVDTPNVDPALTMAEFEALTGMRIVELVADYKHSPIFFGDCVNLVICQYNDGNQQPAAEAIFDNLELRTYETPQVGIERAVRLSWPGGGSNYSVEGAPSVQGPWLPVSNLEPPGLQWMTLPQSDQMKFFRVHKGP
jgi:hypothetical protein